MKRLRAVVIPLLVLLVSLETVPARAVDPVTAAAVVVVGGLVVNEIKEGLADLFSLDGLFNRDCHSFADVYIRALSRAAGAGREDVGPVKPACVYIGGASGSGVVPAVPVSFEEHVKETVKILLENTWDTKPERNVKKCRVREEGREFSDDCLAVVFDRTSRENGIHRILAGYDDEFLYVKIEYKQPLKAKYPDDKCAGRGLAVVSGDRFLVVKQAADMGGACVPFRAAGAVIRPGSPGAEIYYSEISGSLEGEGINIGEAFIFIKVEMPKESYIGINDILIAGFEIDRGDVFLAPFFNINPTPDFSGAIEGDPEILKKLGKE